MTVWRLMQDETFQRYFREARDKAINSAFGTLQGATGKAVECLMKNLDCSVPSVQTQAAKVLLDFSLKVRAQFDYEARIKQLEDALQARHREEAKRGVK